MKCVAMTTHTARAKQWLRARRLLTRTLSCNACESTARRAIRAAQASGDVGGTPLSEDGSGRLRMRALRGRKQGHGDFGVNCTLPCVGWDEYKDGATSLRNQPGRERGCMLIDRTYVEIN